MKQFEDVLEQYEPMISASLRQLNIYRDHENFKQAGRVALWQAWTRYKEGKGHFAAFASRSIRGAMLDELKKENRFADNTMQTDDDVLEIINTLEDPVSLEWSERLTIAIELLSENELELIQWFYIERLTQAECAERAGVSIPGIKKRRERMLIKLRNMLE